MTKKYIVSWDLGQTKCHAGIIEYDANTQALQCINDTTLKLTQVDSLENLIHAIETNLAISVSDTDAICIGASGFYDGSHLLHENPYPYEMNFAHIAKKKQWPSLAVIHDYAPIVCATFTSYMDEVDNIKRLNHAPMQLSGRRVALGIGTGLGLKDGVLLPNGDFWLGQNEIGHIGITTPPSTDAYHRDMHRSLLHYFQHEKSIHHHQALTFEKILAGKGLVHLYQFFYPSNDTLTPEIVGQRMHAGEAKEMVNALAWYIGLFIGTVQLTFMPDGGIWITGGVALNHLHVFDKPDFWEGIHASPAYKLQREEYPLGLLCNNQHALVGCGYYAIKRLINNAQSRIYAHTSKPNCKEAQLGL